MKYPYYVEWNDDAGHIGKAVVVAEDIARAIEMIADGSDYANFANITVVGRIEDIKIIDIGGPF